jgi:type I restriction enzyme, S subunit
MTTFSIIQKSQLEGAMRLDAEYYNPAVRIDFSKGAWNKVSDVLDFVQYGTSEDLNEDGLGFPTLRLNEFDEVFIEKPQKYCNGISEKIAQELELKKDDVLICRTNGNPKLVGKSAIVMSDNKYIFASYLFRVRTKKDILNSASFMTYLNSRIGRGEIERFSLISNQTNFSPATLREIRIPVFSKEFQEKINNLVVESYGLHEQSKLFYQQAEGILLEELGLNSFENYGSLFSIVNLSEVENAERIDAEYFQEKYKKIEKHLKNYEHKKLEDVVNAVSAKVDLAKKPDELFKYVELADIKSSFGVIDSYTEVLGKEAPTRAKLTLKANDVTASCVEGSLSTVALVEKEQEGYIASTGFAQLRSKEIMPEVLLVIAKSIVFQMQMQKRAAGTILTAVPKESMKDIIIPILLKVTQQKIADLVRQSHEARKNAKELLDEAKRKVEEMIEKGGDAK